MSQRKEKIQFIDILKSFACLCVVIGHVIRGLRKAPIELSLFLTAMADYVYFFHVPCFFFASGYLYVKSYPKQGTEYFRFVWKKFIVLGLPYFACSIFYLLAGPIMSSDIAVYSLTNMVKELFTAPVAQYWYLYALFEMFLIVPIIEFILGKVNRLWIFILFIVSAMVIHVDINWITYITSWTCFFYMGVYFRHADLLDRDCIMKKRPLELLLISFTAGIVIYIAYSLLAADIFSGVCIDSLKVVSRLLLVFCIVGSSIAVSKMDNWVSKFLVWLSQYSLYIYLLHTWFTGTTRVLLCRIGIMNCWVHTVCGIAIGVTGSLVAAVIIKRIKVFRFWFEPYQMIDAWKNAFYLHFRL